MICRAAVDPVASPGRSGYGDARRQGVEQLVWNRCATLSVESRKQNIQNQDIFGLRADSARAGVAPFL